MVYELYLNGTKDVIWLQSVNPSRIDLSLGELKEQATSSL